MSQLSIFRLFNMSTLFCFLSLWYSKIQINVECKLKGSQHFPPKTKTQRVTSMRSAGEMRDFTIITFYRLQVLFTLFNRGIAWASLLLTFSIVQSLFFNAVCGLLSVACRIQWPNHFIGCSPEDYILKMTPIVTVISSGLNARWGRIGGESERKRITI